MPDLNRLEQATLAAAEYRAALEHLLDAMPAPRTRKLTEAWDSARRLVAKPVDPA